MQRFHRRLHRLSWLILAPLAAFALMVALYYRPEAPVNEALPQRVEPLER